MGNSQEQEALARQLCAIYIEAQGFSNPAKWEDLDSITRTAWIQVAQFVEATDEERCINRYKGLPMVATVATINEPLATEQDPIVRIEINNEISDLDRDAMKREMMDELRLRVSWDQDRFKRNNNYDPDHK